MHLKNDPEDAENRTPKFECRTSVESNDTSIQTHPSTCLHSSQATLFEKPPHSCLGNPGAACDQGAGA